jgi:RNA ligase (TIGR02306 family)
MNMADVERKLAHIEVVEDLTSIDGADKIETAKILGWHVVVKKGEFKTGDPVIYVEIDSILPNKPEFEFMRERKFRVRTVRLKGQISQGICFHPSILKTNHHVGDDVTKEIGITKLEPIIPAHLAGKIIGQFPSFIQKTDEIRVQNIPNVIKRLAGIECYITEKVDGTSFTAFVKDGVFGVCSRNLQLAETEGNAHWEIAKKNNLEEKMKALNRNISIQGEIIGASIQNNHFHLRERKLLVFNAFDIDKYQYFDFEQLKEIALKLGLEMVPILNENYKLEGDVDALVKMATRKSVLDSALLLEGIVIRSKKEMMDMEMAKNFGSGRVSFKVLNPEYLLKNEG